MLGAHREHAMCGKLARSGGMLGAHKEHDTRVMSKAEGGEGCCAHTGSMAQWTMEERWMAPAAHADLSPPPPR